MNTLKRIIILLTVAVMALSLTACGDTSWIVKVGDTTVNSGLYIFYQAQGYGDALYQLVTEDYSTYFYPYIYYTNYGSVFPELLDETLSSGKTVKEHINSYALSMCEQYVVVDRLFDELGLELSSEDKELINVQVKNIWNSSSETMESIGISKATIEKAVTASVKEDAVFAAYYEVGGTNGTTEEDIMAYLEDNYIRVKYITVPFADSVDDAIDADRKAAAQIIAETYSDRANAGEAMNDLIAEYAASLVEETDEDEDTEADADVEAEADEDEIDVYANETIFYKDATSPSEKFVNYAFNNVKVGECSVIQDDLNFYVVEKLDILERSDIYDENRDMFLQDLFDDDFTKLINNNLSNYTVDVNEKSVKRYKVETALSVD